MIFMIHIFNLFFISFNIIIAKQEDGQYRTTGGHDFVEASSFSRKSGNYQPLPSSNDWLKEDNLLDGQFSLVIEDSFSNEADPVFTPRSIIHIRSVKSNNAVVTHTREWTSKLTSDLKTLASQDGLYRIRAYQVGSEDKGYVSTFTKACLLYESDLSEVLVVMVDGVGNSAVSLSIFTPLSFCSGRTDNLDDASFNTTIIIRSPLNAPVPDTATYIQRLEAMKTEKAEGKDNRSFLAKYWMYIIPVIFILMLSGGGQDNSSGGR